MNDIKNLTKHSKNNLSDLDKKDFESMLDLAKKVLVQCKIEKKFEEEVRLNKPRFVDKVNKINKREKSISKDLTDFKFAQTSTKKLHAMIYKVLNLHKTSMSCVLEITNREIGTID